MDDFEKAAWEIDKNINSDHENVIEWIRNSKIATVTLSQGKYISKVKKLAEKYPDKVQICKVNNDSSIVAHIPVSAIKISITERVMSEEQKAVARERLQKIRKNKDNV